MRRLLWLTPRLLICINFFLSLSCKTQNCMRLVCEINNNKDIEYCVMLNLSYGLVISNMCNVFDNNRYWYYTHMEVKIKNVENSHNDDELGLKLYIWKELSNHILNTSVCLRCIFFCKFNDFYACSFMYTRRKKWFFVIL